MRSDQKFGILFNRGFICIPIYYKKEIIFVGNIYFRIHLKVYLLSNQKLFLLYVNSIRENLFLYVELTIFLVGRGGLSPIVPICFSALHLSYLQFFNLPTILNSYCEGLIYFVRGGDIFMEMCEYVYPVVQHFHLCGKKIQTNRETKQI